jgi:hypothetical protein
MGDRVTHGSIPRVLVSLCLVSVSISTPSLTRKVPDPVEDIGRTAHHSHSPSSITAIRPIDEAVREFSSVLASRRTYPSAHEFFL